MKAQFTLSLLMGAFLIAGRNTSVRLLGKEVNPKFIEHRVGQAGASTAFAYYNTTPESPDGQTIAYVRCEQEPTPQRSRVPASLWVCSKDLQQHRKVTGIKSISMHDGAEAQWIDNNTIALFDNMKLRVIDTRSGKDMLTKELPAAEIGHDSYNGKLLFSICEGKVPGDPAIYELDCKTQAVRTILPIQALAAIPIPSFMNRDSLYPLVNWQLSHLQYSPDGKKICFRIELGPKDKDILMGICNIDGTGLKTWIKPLHFLWYDNESIVGHLSNEPDGRRPDPAERRYSLTRWDLNGKLLEGMMAPRGNHLAISPDRKQFVSESFYKTNPVVVTLYPGAGKTPVEICRFDPHDLTWGRKFHVNPSFSRDGKRVYYSRPLNEKHNGTFYIDIE